MACRLSIPMSHIIVRTHIQNGNFIQLLKSFQTFYNYLTIFFLLKSTPTLRSLGQGSLLQLEIKVNILNHHLKLHYHLKKVKVPHYPVCIKSNNFCHAKTWRVFWRDKNNEVSQSSVFFYIVGMGICSTDWTSKNVHALVWSVYQTIITTAVPFLLELILYSIISCKNPYNIAAVDKTIRADDIRALRFYRGASVTYFLLTVVYFTMDIGNLNGVYIHPTVIFLTSLVYFTSSVSILIGCLVVEFEPLTRIMNVVRDCWQVSRGKFSSECAEISIKKSTLHKMKERNFREQKAYL